jgi:excisionase family DNA binding protein
MMDKILTIPEVSEYLKVSKAKIYMLVAKNQIPYIRLDRNVRVRESDLLRWLEERTMPRKRLDNGSK